MTWVDCTTGGSPFAGWAADVGLWGGEWPLQTPTATDGLSSGDEIDYFVGLPNPSDPTNPYVALDGSYPAQFWAARLILPDTVSFDSYGSGGLDFPMPDVEPPVGAHLYVVVTSGEPAAPPLTYVPASYATGGLAQEPPGRWSAWQTGFTLTKMVTPDSGSGWNGTAMATVSDPHPDTPFFDLTDKLLGDAKRPLVATAGGVSSGSVLHFGADRNTPTFIDTTGHTQLSLTLNQLSANWNGAPTNPYPTPLDSLTAGTDYDTAPFIGQAWEYESPDPVSWSWPETMPVEAGGKMDDGYPYGDAAGTSLTGRTQVTVTVLDAPVVDGSTEPAYGTEIASIRVTSGDAPFDGTIGDFYTVLLPNDLGVTFTLSAQTQMLAGPAAGWDDNIDPEIGGTSGYAWDAAFLFGDESGDALEFTWTTTRWRYWMPNGPVLKTVGENFLAGNGEAFRVKSLIPGYGWVPVQRYG